MLKIERFVIAYGLFVWFLSAEFALCAYEVADLILQFLDVN